MPASTAPADPPAWLTLRPASAMPGRRRVAATLLREALLEADGTLLEQSDGGLLVLAAPPPALARAALLLAPVFGAEALGRPAAPPAGLRPLPGLPGTAPRFAVASPPVEVGAGRQVIVGLGGGRPRLAGLRLGALPPLPAGAPPHLARHARDVQLRRNVAQLGTAAGRLALLGADPAVPVHLELPADGLTAEEAAGLADLPVLPLLPLSALAAERRRPAADLLALDIPDAAALTLLDPSALPGAALHLRWGAALEAVPERTLAAIGPGRVVLEDVGGEEGLRWGLEQGISRFAGPHPSRLLAALRRRDCALGAGCTTEQCSARSAAADAPARAGCGRPEALLHGPGEAA